MRNDSELNESTPSFRAYAELLRLPNVFTAAADVMMGYLVVHQMFEPVSPLIILVVSSCCLYLAGMVYNDIFDRHVDAVERPERPIPSGRVPLGAARVLGAVLLCAALALSFQLSWKVDNYRPFEIAVGIGLLAIAYDWWLKRTLLGPVAMGGCRFLNVLLGMSLFDAPYSGMHWMIAGGVGIYIAGLTIFAGGEASVSHRGRLYLGTAIMLTGTAMVAIAPRFVGENQEWLLAGTPPAWPYFWLIFGAHLVWRNGRALVIPSPKYVQAAVKSGILSLIVIDAAASVPMAALGAFSSMFILLLIIPATFLGRWIYST